MPPKVFVLPGLYNSGPQHWQTHWENKYGFTRINQQDWETPHCADWIKTIDDVITGHDLSESILVAHSLSCCTVVHWFNTYKRNIKGALLVAPSDVEASSYPPGTTGFTPMPLTKIPFRTIVSASSTDEYVSMERAQQFANAWGSSLVNIGDYGHINSASDLGLWPKGYELLKELM